MRLAVTDQAASMGICAGDEAAAKKLHEAVDQPPPSKRQKSSSASAAEPQQVGHLYTSMFPHASPIPPPLPALEPSHVVDSCENSSPCTRQCQPLAAALSSSGLRQAPTCRHGCRHTPCECAWPATGWQGPTWTSATSARCSWSRWRPPTPQMRRCCPTSCPGMLGQHSPPLHPSNGPRSWVWRLPRSPESPSGAAPKAVPGLVACAMDAPDMLGLGAPAGHPVKQLPCS